MSVAKGTNLGAWWHRIDDAPKDQQPIIACDVVRQIARVSWRDSPYSEQYIWGGDDGQRWKPTHFRTIPALPTLRARVIDTLPQEIVFLLKINKVSLNYKVIAERLDKDPKQVRDMLLWLWKRGKIRRGGHDYVQGPHKRIPIQRYGPLLPKYRPSQKYKRITGRPPK